MKQTIKGATKSKTIWFNAIVGGLLALEPVFPLLQVVLGPSAYAIGMIVLTVGNVILRAVTDKELG